MADQSQTTEATLDADIGALLCRQFRSELERTKFLGHKISWHESKGWLESHFTIRAPAYVVHGLSEMLKKWECAPETKTPPGFPDGARTSQQ